MELLVSWAQSVELFRLPNLKLFLLASAGSLLQAMQIAFTRWAGILILLGVVFTLRLLPFYVPVDSSLQLFLSNFLYYLFIVLVLAFWALALRASIAQKSVSYVLSVGASHWIYLFLCVLVQYGEHSAFLLHTLLLMFLFHAFDAGAAIKNIPNTVVSTGFMIWYNLPALIILVSCLGCFVGLAHAAWLFILPADAFIVFYSLCLVPIIGAVISTFYLKKIHEQSDLYFPRPK